MKKKIHNLLTCLFFLAVVFLTACSDLDMNPQKDPQGFEPSSQTISQKSSKENTKQTSQKTSSQQASSKQTKKTHKTSNKKSSKLSEDGWYYDLNEVALYIHQFGHLPDNYITKSEADQRGWSTRDRDYVVGGNKFGNREGKLPKAKNRQYYEADVQSGYTSHRGPERIIFSNDGLIFYTDDHYESFEQLY